MSAGHASHSEKPLPKVTTIGVYESDEETFFQALLDAGVDTFVDLRQRRGLRGARYAFANSRRLQARLAELGIRYVHRKDLAPTTAIRQRQKEADKAAKIPRRQRKRLSPVFVETFRQEILGDFEPHSLLDDLPPDAEVITLFCVEREPAACHRSLVADVLEKDLGLEVEHLLP